MSNLQLPTYAAQANPAPIPDTDKRYAELKEKAGRFRVLIIGGANAGKTTILQKICNTTDEPEIISKGKKIDLSTLEPTSLRGYHDIEDEMEFRSNPTLVFHDSRGFEAGGVDEFRKAKIFVAECAAKKKLSERIHVIWYCIAMDDDRPVTYAEKQFFEESGTGKVPVITVFTKCEALELKAITRLEEEGYDFDEAVERAPSYVEEYQKKTQEMLEGMSFPPKGFVYLQELDKPEKDCQDLVKCTAEVLDSKVLQGLFISTQENSLEFAMEYSLRNALKKVLLIEEQEEQDLSPSPGFEFELLKEVLGFFPYHFYERKKDYHNQNFFYDGYYYNFGNFYEGKDKLKDLNTPHVKDSLKKLMSNYKHCSIPFQLIHYSCALSILAEHLSVLWSYKSVSPHDIPPICEFYQMSSCHTVMQAIDTAISNYCLTLLSSSKDPQMQDAYALTNELLPVLLQNRLDKSNL